MTFFRHNLSKQIEYLGKEARYFSEDLYEEHLEEVSFLYESRMQSLGRPDGAWPDMASLEDRVEAHIKALYMGGGLAFDMCRHMIGKGGPGVLYAAVRVSCHHKKDEWFEEIMNGLDPENNDQAHAVIHALNHDLPVEWHPLIEQMLLSANPALSRMALSVIGHRRIPMDETLKDLMERPHDETFALIVRTLGRLSAQSIRDHLSFLFYNSRDEDFIKHELCMALLRLQEKDRVPVPTDKKEQPPWVYRAMGLSGGASHAAYLNDIAMTDGVCHECLLALGFLGYVSSVDVLIAHLNGGPCSETAALALQLITGAELMEEVFVKDPINENALFPHELEKLRKGEPLYPSGNEPGITLHRISQNPVDWKAWWMVRQCGFDLETSYRYGKPRSPSGILQTLEAEKNPAFLRQQAYEELVIRYNKDIHFDLTLPVSLQRKALNACRAWADAYL